MSNLNPGADWERLRGTVGRDALNLVVNICGHQDQAGRYYIVENPSTSYAWVYDGILDRRQERFHGKTVVGDQCA